MRKPRDLTSKGPTKSELVLVLVGGAAALGIGLYVGAGGNPLPLVGAVAALALVYASIRHFEWVLVAAVLGFFAPAMERLSEIPGITSIRWVLLGWALFLALVRFLGPGREWVTTSFSLSRPLALLVAFFLLSYLWSIAPRLTLERSLSFVGMVALMVLVFWGGFASKDLLRMFRIAAVILALGGVYALLADIRTPVGRYAGLFINPNALGIANALLFPAVAAEVLRSGRLSARLWNLIIALLLVGESFYASSRAGLMALVAGYAYLLWSRGDTGRRRARLAAIIVPTVVAAVVSIVTYVPHRFSNEDTRSSIWKAFGKVYSDSPFIGHGFGTTEEALKPYAALIRPDVDDTALNFHNSYLNLLHDVGVIGALIFLALAVTALRRRKGKDPAFTAILVGGLVSGVFESWMFSVGSGFPIIFWMSIYVLLQPRPEVASIEEEVATQPPPYGGRAVPAPGI